MLPGHMNAKHARRLLLLAVLLAAIVLAPAARAQEDDRAPVRLDGRSNFHFHRSLLGLDGWGKFDDHNWGLLEDH